MKKMTGILLVALGLIGTRESAAQAVVRTEDEKTYTVELISADANAKTITIQSDNGPSNLVVDERALADLQRVKPGDKISVTVRDDASGRRQIVTAIVNGTITSKPEETAADKTVMLKSSGTPVEFINLDPKAKKVTVLGDHGLKRVFVVDEKAMVSLTDVKPGQKVLLSYRFDAEGKPEAVVRVTPAPVLPKVRLEGGTAVEVVSTYPSAKTLTVRREGGESQTLMVDDQAVLELNDLKTGESVLVTLKDGKVAVISRTR